MKRSILILLVLTGLMTAACEKSSSEFCGGDRPEKTLTWLKEEIDLRSSSPYCQSISRSTYRNQTVFIFTFCDPNVNSIPQLYDCDGNLLSLTVEEYQNLNFTGPIELIWKNR
jgi:hypothetical protein